MLTKTRLEELYKKYETKEFILSDPIQFPHKFNNKKDIEIAGFLASLFAFGSRKIFIQKLKELFCIMEEKPFDYIINGDFNNLGNINYRFAKTEDIKNILNVLSKLYKESNGLEELFYYGFTQHNSIKAGFSCISDYFYTHSTQTQGFNFMIANPNNGGAMKRMNMFLRWMVRKSEVDLGIWNCIPTSDLLIPLDVHVSNVSRKLGLLKRSSNDFKAVLELTNKLKEFDPNDPVKYDFALFGAGIEGIYRE